MIHFPHRRSRRRGQALLPMALSLTALIGMVGLAVDTTRAYLVRALLISAVDGAVMAAARVPEPKMNQAARAVFQANFPNGALGASERHPASLQYEATSGKLRLDASASIDTFFMTVLGQPRVVVTASATALRAPSGPGAPMLLLADEDTIGPSVASLREYCLGSGGGAGEQRIGLCLNSDIAGDAVRAPLFARPNPPESGPALLSLPAGQVGDEGLFQFAAAALEQFDRRSRRSFTAADFVNATGAAASRNNLSEVEDVAPLRQADLEALSGREACVVVFDGDIAVEPGQHYGRLDGPARGIAAFRVEAVAEGERGSMLPELTVELLSAKRAVEVCAQAAAAAGAGASLLR